MTTRPITLGRLLELLPADQEFKVKLIHDGRLEAEGENIHLPAWDSLNVGLYDSLKIQYERGVLVFTFENF